MLRLPLVSLSGALLATTWAGAQVNTFEVRVSNMISPAEPTATVELWAHFDPQWFAFAEASLSVYAPELGGAKDSGWIEPTFVLEGYLSSPGVVAEGGSWVNGVFPHQDGYHPDQADPSNPIMVWAGVWGTSDFDPRTVTVTTFSFLFDVYEYNQGPIKQLRYEPGFVDGTGTIQIVPAPGAGGVIALGAVAASRRRR